MYTTGGWKQNQNRWLGFTLIELILVILFISIVIGISNPLFQKTFSYIALKNTSFNIAKAVNYAADMAIIDGVTYKLNFDSDKGCFWITKFDKSSDADGSYIRLDSKYGRVFSLPAGLVFTESATEVMFYPDGRSEEKQIKIQNREGNSVLLCVKGFGRQAVIEENYE